MSMLDKLIRPDLLLLQSYKSARSEAGDFNPDITIDANESPWPPFGSIATQVPVHRYPEPQSLALRQRLAAVYGGITSDQIYLSRGSDEGIDSLIRLFCRAGQDEILICPPTFGMYQVYAGMQGAGVISVPLRKDDGQLDVPAILKAATPNTKVIFIPSPNAPMGHMMKRADLLELCKARSSQSIIVADEAYIEFTDEPQGMIPELASQPNLAILRTLSKAHALAGERMGCVIGSIELVMALRRVMSPYPQPQSSIKAALDALSANGIVTGMEYRRTLIGERERLVKLLPQSKWILKVYPSVANFLLIETQDAAAFMKHLRGFGILPRSRHTDIPNTVRLSLGTPAQNDLILKALGVTIEQSAKSMRLFSARRATKETSIAVTVNLDAPSFLKAETGIGFFDHMLAQLATHGGFGLELHCAGDLIIDQHHTIEDCALALGEALKGALGDKRGIGRFGFTAPLDEAVSQVVIDLSGRPYASFNGKLPAETVGLMTSEMVPHFFHSLATAMNAAIHITVTGDNTHHMIEATFKAVGRALRQAFKPEGQADILPSTKGVL